MMQATTRPTAMQMPISRCDLDVALSQGLCDALVLHRYVAQQKEKRYMALHDIMALLRT